MSLDINTVISDPSSGSTGVLIYNTCASGSCFGLDASGPIQRNSNARSTVSPYGDPYENIVIWQDRASDTQINFDSNAFTATGAIYSSTTDIHFDSNSRTIVDVTGMSTVGLTTFALSE